MGFLGDIERALGVWYKDPDDSPDDTNPQIVEAFADYTVLRLSGDFVCEKRGNRVLGEPNLTVTAKKSSVSYDIITCYRSRMFIGEDGEAYLPWTCEETYEKYLAFAKTSPNPCYVIIGLHGFADSPKFVFAVPLGKADIDLKKSTLSEFEKGKRDKLLEF